MKVQTKKHTPTFATVPALWPGETIVCIGGGTVTHAEVDQCRCAARVVAVNDAYRLAPWADVLYACDAAWWTVHRGVPTFAGRKYGLEADAAPWGVEILQGTGRSGLEVNPSGLRTGRNSGYQAINLAVHLGAARIVLIGYDCGRLANKRAHWFGEHPSSLNRTSEYLYREWRQLFATLVKPVAERGITILNASTHTTLECFPRASLLEALRVEARVAC